MKMVIKYWSCSTERDVIWVNISALKGNTITNWRITDELGYKDKGGSLIIDFTNGGIYPPVPDIPPHLKDVGF